MRISTGIVTLAALVALTWVGQPAATGEAANGRKPGPQPPSQSIGLLAIDTGVTGNTPTSFGTVESCASVTTGASVTIDIVVDSVPAEINQHGGILAFQFELRYKKRALAVESVDNAQMLTANAGSSPIEFTDPLPDRDGSLVTIYADLGEGEPESGAGVLSRITLRKLSRATASIEIANPIIVDASNDSYTFQEVRGAKIVTNASCR